MSLGPLYVGELRALFRGRFAWLGAAVVLAAMGGLAAAATQDTWIDGYGLIAYVVVPLAFIPFAASAIASPRANRFVESVFTAPVRRRDWLAAKVLVLLTLALAYYLALVPMMLVFVAHVGWPFWLQKFLLWTPGILVACVGVGTLVGVLFIGRSVAAPLATAVGVLLAYAGLLPLQILLVGLGHGATAIGRLALASPPVLLMNGLGFAVAGGSIPSSATRTWISFVLVVVGSFALAAWIFLREQGVESWETTRARKYGVALAIAALLLLPAVLAETSYDTPAPPLDRAPSLRGLAGGPSGAPLALASPGGPPPARCCSALLTRDGTPLDAETDNAYDLLILLPVDANASVANVTVKVVGEANLSVAVDAAAQKLETRTYANDTGPAAPDGHRVQTGWVVRVPVALKPMQPWDVGGMRYPLNVTADYVVAGEAAPRVLVARAAVEALVADAWWQMAIAGAILPAICLGAAVARWRRTR